MSLGQCLIAIAFFALLMPILLHPQASWRIARLPLVSALLLCGLLASSAPFALSIWGLRRLKPGRFRALLLILLPLEALLVLVGAGLFCLVLAAIWTEQEPIIDSLQRTR